MRRTFLLFILVSFCGPVLAGSDPLERVARELAAGIEGAGESRVVVLGIVNRNPKSTEGPRIVSDRLTALLAENRKLRLVERNQTAQLLKELHLSETGLIAPKTAAHAGRVLGADIIVTGTLIDLDNDKTELNARALYADSGRVICASRTVLNREWRVPNRLSDTTRRREKDQF